MRDSPRTKSAKARYILATDGVTLEAEDLSSGETVACDYADLPNHFGFFLPLAGITTVRQIRESAFDIRATSRLNKLYLELLKDNPDWGTPERRSAMNHFMARLIFCFFAEDTSIIPGQRRFTLTIDQMSARDSSDTHEVIATLFRAMNTKPGDRAAAGIPRWADAFPYVNGGLFSGGTEVPRFSKIARSYLLHIGNLDWRQINPDIFGSMIQAVADDEERGALGMHYTSVPNILKVLNPLFLDDLRAQLEAARDNPRMLLNLRKRMSRIRVFDPACGSGNFLVIAYKEMRAIEAEINRLRGEADRRTEIPLTNFRGIELREFPAEIARLALIIAEYQADELHRGQKEAIAGFLPLAAENWITCGNALRLDWVALCGTTGSASKITADDLFQTPLDQAEIDFENVGGETYICGNPPYLGGKWQSEEQKDDLARAFEGTRVNWKSLDYVAGWFIKAAKFAQFTPTRTAFVATNSICQGQQVPILWPTIFSFGQQIAFAHTSFKWANLAANNAGVIVVIVGLDDNHRRPRTLYSISEDGRVLAQTVENISPYLSATPTVFVEKVGKAPPDRPTMLFGNMPRDGGNLLLSSSERAELLSSYPAALPLIKRFIGSEDMIRGNVRYCLWISDELSIADGMPPIRARLDAVEAERSKSPAESTRQFAKRPHRFVQIQGVGRRHAFVVPRVSSERRNYIPVDMVDANTIVADSAFALYDAPLWCFSILSSAIHLSWIGAVCGKLKTDLRYSNTIGWNTFPLPNLFGSDLERLEEAASNILIARERHYPASLAELYDPESMPDSLKAAHMQNDEIIERAYIGRRFKNDSERLDTLFSMFAAASR